MRPKPPLEVTDLRPDSHGTTLGRLAELVGGELRGDASLAVTDAGPLDDAEPGMIVLVDHADRLARGEGSTASALVVPVGTDAISKPAIVVEDVHAAFRLIVGRFHAAPAFALTGVSPEAAIDPTALVDPKANIHARAVIGAGAQIGAGATIHAGVVIGPGASVGAGSEVFSNAALYAGVSVGERCLIHAGAVIGAYGFGYSQKEGRHVLAAQLGGVEVGDEVEVGAGACIDRGVYGPTRVGEGTKIDNLVQIGHNCQIGRHNLICSQVGIAGSTRTGDYVVMAGQAGVRDHVMIGDGAQLGAMCGVSNDVAAGESVLGAPAVPLRDQKLRFAAIAKLPEMRKEFKRLRKQVQDLQKLIDDSAETSDPEQNQRAA